MNNENEIVDLLIIGSGVAGCVAALEASKHAKLNIMVITPASEPEEANTYYAQGGIIGRGPSDSAELLMTDLYRAGAEVNYPPAVELLATEGPRLLEKYLIDMAGVALTRTTRANWPLPARHRTRPSASCTSATRPGAPSRKG